jgi:hypothetical protein
LTLLASFVVTLLPPCAAFAGGPILVNSNGAPYLWSTATPITYRTDNGPLSAGVDEATARARILAMFNVWQDVPTSRISYARATTDAGNGVGFIAPTSGFTGGDVNTLAEYDAVEADCNNGIQSPVIYDADRTIMTGLGMDSSVIGFAGPCSTNGSQFIAGQVVMNGLFAGSSGFDAAIIHEIGHFSGLDHSQINVNCLVSCGADALAGLPTMFPFLVDSSSQQTLSDDDIAWISRLYPQTTGGTTFAGSYGTITGTVFFSDGQSHAQGVNVIACRVGAGTGTSCTNAVSVVSGFKFTSNPGQSVTANYLPCTRASDCPPNGFFDNNSGGDFSGSRQTGDIGYFELSVPSGFAYTVRLETINRGFDKGSSVGPLSPPIPMPGTFPSPVTTAVVNANETVPVGNLVLTGTAARFDQFEGP